MSESNNIDHSKFIFTGVLGGKITGQINTANFVLSIIISELQKKEILILDQPHLSRKFIFDWLKYLYKNTKILINSRISTVYFISNRTRKSFWLREIFPILLAYVNKSDVYYHIVGNDFIDFYNSLNFFERFIYLLPEKNNKLNFIVLGDLMKKDIIKSLSRDHVNIDNDKFILLPAFISKAAVTESGKYFNKINKKEGISVGFMSNLIFEKGINYFLKAVFELYKNNSNITCWVAGPKISNVNYELLDFLIDNKIINYYPFLDGKKKWEVLSDTDIFVLPTFYKSEYLPLAIIDAMLCGCYTVTCDTGEIRKYIDEHSGVIVGKRNVNEILKAIADFNPLNNLLRRKKIRDTAIELFSEKKYINNLSKVWSAD
jgi:glycosyltransferase involved in cell wall biosynthesis